MAPIRDCKLHRLERPRRCLVCPLVFDPSVTWQRFCSARCRDLGSTKRKSIALAEWICLYCGEVGDSVDHVPPTSTRPVLRELGIAHEYPFVEVRSCRECNSALSDLPFWTTAERKRYIKRWLTRRYARLLGMPDWTPDELLALGPNLAGHVSISVYKKQLIERRLRH